MHGKNAFRRLLPVCLSLVVLLAGVPAARGQQQEVRALDLESSLQQLLESTDAEAVYTDLGDGFHSVSVALSPEARERFLATLGSDGAEKALPFYLLASGQQLTDPANPSVCIHASLSSVSAPYNYWLVVLNLSSQNVTRTTTVKLTGPGLKFSKAVSATYNANGIWAVWYNPGVGVGRAGLYTLKASVASAGTFVIRTYAVP